MIKTMISRLLSGALALAAGLALAAAPASAQQTVKIGVILTYSGPAASLGDEIDKGLSLYVKEHQKDLPPGVKVELLKRDDTGPDPETAKRLAQELITRDHVQFLTGVVWSPNAAAIAPLATEAKVPFVIMNAAGAGLTRASPYIARVSFTLWQSSYPLGKWAASHGMKRLYTAVSDYAPGHDGEEAVIKGFTEAGGTVVGSVRFPLKDQDFAPYLQRVKDAKPDVLYVFVPSGKQAAAVMKAYEDLGLKADGVKLIGPQDIVPDAELPGMGDCGPRRHQRRNLFGGLHPAAEPRLCRRLETRLWRRLDPGFHVGQRLGRHGGDLQRHQGDEGPFRRRPGDGSAQGLEEPEQPARPGHDRSGDA